MTDEERLHMVTEQLILVRDNLFRGMSKSMQKLQARSINEALELENFTVSAQPAQQDIPDLIAGALGVSRGTAYDMMREALAEQSGRQEPVENVELDVAVLRQQLLGRAEFLRDRGEIKSPQLMEMAAELIYTTPQAQPAREWVGLTDEDKQIAFDDTQEGGGFWDFADAIEAILKRKNK